MGRTNETRQAQMEQAQAFADAHDKNDPFAMARYATWIKNGLTDDAYAGKDYTEFDVNGRP